jgi:hypothetical protein
MLLPEKYPTRGMTSRAIIAIIYKGLERQQRSGDQLSYILAHLRLIF